MRMIMHAGMSKTKTLQKLKEFVIRENRGGKAGLDNEHTNILEI